MYRRSTARVPKDFPCETARAAAITTLHQLLNPLAEFVLDSGISVGEFNTIFRETTVNCAAAKQLKTCNRTNFSGIAAVTGMPRDEISRILRNTGKSSPKRIRDQHASTYRVIKAWHKDSRYCTADGLPADLKLYGRDPTLDGLVKRYGRGLPTRAIIDELLRSQSVELVSGGKIRVSNIVASGSKMSDKAVKDQYRELSQLMELMLRNATSPENRIYATNFLSESISSGSLASLRGQVSTKAAEFLTGVQELFRGNPARSSRGPHSTKVFVSLICQEHFDTKVPTRSERGRRNFRRTTSRDRLEG